MSFKDDQFPSNESGEELSSVMTFVEDARKWMDNVENWETGELVHKNVGRKHSMEQLEKIREGASKELSGKLDEFMGVSGGPKPKNISISTDDVRQVLKDIEDMQAEE